MEKIKKFIFSEIVKGSLALFFMMNIFNVLNYVFQFSMAQFLTIESYGILGVVMSLIYIYSIPSEAIQGVFSKYASKFNKDEGKIKALISKGVSKGLFYSFIVLILLEIGSIFLALFLNINYWIFFVANFFIVFVVFVSVLRGILQGRKKFLGLGYNLIADAVFKLIVAIGLVMVGWGIYGPIVGLISGSLFAIFLGTYSLRKALKKDKKNVELKGIRGQGESFLIAMVAVVLMYSLDTILAKRFFDAITVGKYTVIAMLGRIIFFGTFPISKVLLPFSSENHNSKKTTKPLFFKSALIIFVLSLLAIAVYWFFPRILIGLLFGEKYIDFYKYLIYVAIGLSFLSFSNLIIIYGLSIDRFNKSYSLLIFVFIEIILLYLFHETILQFVLAFMTANIIMFIGCIILIKRRKENEKSDYSFSSS